MLDTTLVRLDMTDLNIPLHTPFGIATGAQPEARNLLITAELSGGTRGFGEAAPFPAVNGETQAAARAAIAAVREDLLGHDARAFRRLGTLLLERIPQAASARCAIETALLDALCRHYRVPLWVLFGGAAARLQTDLTITTGTPAAARQAARRIREAGFATIKLKVGGCPLSEDVARIAAVVEEAPALGLLLDGNCGLAGAEEALCLVQAARQAGGQVVLLEQPLPRGHAELPGLSARTGVPIAADEDATSVADVVRLARERAAQVINIKIMKSGLVEALEMAAAARALGLGLMIGAMVESPLAIATSASLAAGQGGFSFVDLDTHLFMRDIPLSGGFVQSGPLLDLSGIAAGHGVVPAG